MRPRTLDEFIGQAHILGPDRPLRAAIDLDPGFVDAWLALGQALGQLGETEAALQAFRTAGDLAPSRMEARYLAAATLDAAGRLSEALPEARAAVGIAPGDPTLRRFLGRLLLRVEQWPEAQDELEEAIRLGYRSDPGVLADLGAALLGQERLAAARLAFERHRELAPGDPGTLLQLGYLAWREGDHERSAALLEEAIALDPELRRAHHFLGLTAFRRDDLAGAEAAFRRALDSGEDFPEAWLHLGKIALRRGDAESAKRHFETAIRHAPDYADAWYQLSFAERRLGDREAATRSLARFRELR